MTATNITRLLHLACFLIVTSQLLYYVFVMGDAMKMTSIGNFIEQRKIVDPMVHQRHIPFYYACLILGILLMAMQYKQWNSWLFITTAIATIALVTDIVIALQVNAPINKYINNWQEGTADAVLEAIRLKWIYFIKLRGLISFAGMIVLLVGLVFDRKDVMFAF